MNATRQHPPELRCHSVRWGWMFGQRGPVVAHAPEHVKRECPGAWIWFCTDTVCFVTNDTRPEPCDTPPR